MRIKKVFQLSLFSVFITLHSLAQTAIENKVWTLEQCIDYALKNNISVKQSELNTELSQINLTQSEANLLPNLNGNFSHNYNFGRTVDRFTNQFATQQVLSQNLYLSSDFNLFSGLQNVNTIKENKFNYLASKYDVDKMKNDISLSIASAYLQILYSIEGLDNAKNQMGITSAQVDRTKKLVEAGAAAKGTLLDIQSQLATEELNVTSAQNNLDISYLSLAQLLNMPSAEGFTIVKPEIAIANEALLTATPSQIYSTAISNLPEIKSADYKVKSAEKAMDVALGGLSPRLTFSASYGTGYSGASKQLASTPTITGAEPNGDFIYNGTTPVPVYTPSYSNLEYETIPWADQYKNNVNKSFGLNLSVPIFNRFQVKSSIDKARIQKLNADYTVESTKLQIQKNIQQAYADANAALKKYASTQKALEAMQESYKYTEQKFNVGMVNTTDYNTAKNKLTTTQSQLLQAKYEVVFKKKVLDFYQGKPLKF